MSPQKERNQDCISLLVSIESAFWVGNTERNFGIHTTNVRSGRTVRLTSHEGDHAPDWR